MRRRKKSGKLLAQWKEEVAKRYGYRCVVCEALGQQPASKLQCHHIVSSNNPRTRYDAANGVYLCARHHAFHPVYSIHKNPLFVLSLLIAERGSEWVDTLLEHAGALQPRS